MKREWIIGEITLDDYILVNKSIRNEILGKKTIHHLHGMEIYRLDKV